MTREEAIEVLKHNYPSACFTDLCEAVEIAIQSLSAQPERKKGEWIEHTNYIECNKCHSLFTFNGNYCSNCGADMRKEVKSC